MSNNNHEISLQQAIEMTTRYRENKPSNFPLNETFNVEAIEALISTQGCKSLRVYYGMKEDFSACTILVAADADGEDLLPHEGDEMSADNNNIIVEDGFRCPPDCPPKSPLNGD